MDFDSLIKNTDDVVKRTVKEGLQLELYFPDQEIVYYNELEYEEHDGVKTYRNDLFPWQHQLANGVVWVDTEDNKEDAIRVFLTGFRVKIQEMINSQGNVKKITAWPFSVSPNTDSFRSGECGMYGWVKFNLE